MRFRSVAMAVVIALCVAPMVALGVSTSTGTPPITLTETAPQTVLFGGTATVTLTAANPSGPYGYNTTFKDILPAGTSYVAGSSTPVAPQVISNQPSSGQTTLIWSNVADLSQGASTSVTFQVAHTTTNSALIEVGTTYTDQASAYINTDPRLVPQFNASGASPSNYTGAATTTASTTITPFTLTATGGGTELRGVHDHQFVHTLTLTNNAVNPTANAGVDQYLPAGLEFLGCGNVDHTTNAPTNAPNAVEYPNAQPLGAGITTGDCPTPDSVATVTDPPGLPAGVYTHIHWTIGTLAASQITTFSYVTAIPLRENTTTFSGTEPTPASLDQTANLDNNAGPNTFDGQSLVSYATASGTYEGPTTPDVTAPQTATAQIANVAKDLVIGKSPDRATIDIGGITTWTLTVTTSEYEGSTTQTVTDTLPNGLCPLGVTSAGAYTYEPDCGLANYSVANYGPSLSYASAVENVTPNPGTWTITWNTANMGPNATQSLNFKTLTRSAYQYATGSVPALADNPNGPVLAGDQWTNAATVSGTTAIRVENANPIDDVPNNGQTISAGASAVQRATQPTITKWVAIPSTVTGNSCPTSASDYVTALNVPSYRPGDLVCWRVQVVYANALNTNVTALTDFLPPGQTYAGINQPGPTNDLATTLDSSTPGQLVWSTTGGRALNNGTVVPSGGRTFDAIFASIGTPSTISTSEGYLVNNLAKLSTTNSTGISSSPRADATYGLLFPNLGLVKGVAEVTRAGKVVAGPFGTNRDGVTVEPGDEVTFRVDVANTGNDNAVNATVWDVLPTTPVQITCADVVAASLSAGGTCDAATNTIHWTGVSVAAGSSETLLVTYRVPTNVLSSFASLTDRAGVVSYEGETRTGNLGDGYVYVPTNNIDPAQTPNAPAASDPSNVVIASPALTKAAETSLNEAGNTNSQVTIGELVHYTVRVPLVRETVLTDAKITDVVSSRLALDDASVVVNATPQELDAHLIHHISGQTITIDLPTPYTVPTDGASITLTFTARVKNDAANTLSSASITNAATFSATVAGTTKTTTSNTVAEQVVEPRLSITKSDNSVGKEVEAGDVVAYTLEVHNSSTSRVSSAHDVVVTDTVPAGFCVRAGTPTAVNPPVLSVTVTRTCAEGQIITWHLHNLAPGAAERLRYEVTISHGLPEGSLHTNVARVDSSSITGGTSEGGRDYTAEASDQIKFVVRLPDLRIVKTHDGPMTRGATGRYSIVVTNHGDKSTSGTVTVTDTPPAGMYPLGATGTGWSCHVAGRTLTCTCAHVLAPGESYPAIELTVAIASNAPDTLDNLAEARGGGSRTELTESRDPTEIVGEISDTVLTLRKTALTRTITAGGTATYRIAIHAPGPHAVFDAVVCDTPPAYTSYVSSSGGHYARGQVCWHIPYLHVGGTVTETIRLRIATTAPSTGIINTASAGARNAPTTHGRALVRIRGVLGVGGVTG